MWGTIFLKIYPEHLWPAFCINVSVKSAVHTKTLTDCDVQTRQPQKLVLLWEVFDNKHWDYDCPPAWIVWVHIDWRCYNYQQDTGVFACELPERSYNEFAERSFLCRCKDSILGASYWSASVRSFMTVKDWPRLAVAQRAAWGPLRFKRWTHAYLLWSWWTSRPQGADPSSVLLSQQLLFEGAVAVM